MASSCMVEYSEATHVHKCLLTLTWAPLCYDAAKRASSLTTAVALVFIHASPNSCCGAAKQAFNVHCHASCKIRADRTGLQVLYYPDFAQGIRNLLDLTAEVIFVRADLLPGMAAMGVVNESAFKVLTQVCYTAQ